MRIVCIKPPKVDRLLPKTMPKPLAKGAVFSCYGPYVQNPAATLRFQRVEDNTFHGWEFQRTLRAGRNN